MKSPILGAAYVARSINAADNRLINMYPESTPDGGKTAAYFQRVPGIFSYEDFGGSGSIRGMWVVKGVLYVVAGNRFISVVGLGTNNVVTTTINSSVSGTGPVSIIDNGTQIFIAQSIQAVGFSGEIALIGVLTREGDTSPHAMMFKGASMRGIFVGSRGMAERLNAFVDTHGIKPVVDRTFALDDAKSAYAYQSSPDLFGKTVITL